ncbi:MAG: carboxypeptidase regulatory-like domain-containing protein [Thermoplasmata archaeon]
MESTSSGWWHRHGWTVAILLSAFGISFALRTIWAYPVVSQWGPLFTYAGGSDSYYHSRVMQYIILNHTNLIHDPLLQFPVGAINPREPLFDWMNAILGIIFAPFFGGNAVVAGAWFLDLQAPLWAALGVFPVYLIGREVSGRRTGLIAAVIFPFLSGNIDSSIFGYANYLSFYTFIILVVVYSYIRTVKAVGSRRWVEDYRHPRQYIPAVRAFVRTERSAVKWAVFTGVSLGTLALAWQGYTYGVVVIAISLVVAMVVERIRRVDSFGLYVATWIVGLVGFPMAMPYYLVQQQFAVWFDLPLLIFFGALALLLPFLLMRDIPWVFSVPFLVAVFAAGVGALAVVSPTYFTSLVTGQGYFVKNLIYSTVAEAQAPSIDQLVLGYGVVTFFLAFAGLAIFVYLLVQGRFKRHHVVFLVFSLLSLYLPISAAKFFLVGSPIFALLPAEAIRRALDVAGYGELRRTTASLSDRRSQFSAFRKAFKPRHVLVMALVLIVVLPNVWVAIDAGIPGNTKSEYAAQVGATLPPWLQLNTSNPSNYYFGAAGTSLDTPNQYDSAGYNWLAQQDTNVPAPQRPAFVSWWDYGFQAIAQGAHPSVADNFQNGIDPAGQFLLSQNESQAIGVLATTLLAAEQRASGLPDLPPALNQILAADGLNTNQLHNLLVNTGSDYNLVVAHPERYLPVDASTITPVNAMYLAMAYFLATSLPLNGVAKVYNDIQSYTGWSIRYTMTDTRLFPFSGTDTGIFYAPAELTGRVIDSTGAPSTFFNLSVLGSDGNYYSPNHLPAGVTQVGSPVVNYFAPFYNSMIYRTYIGYNGTDIGSSPGIPGLSSSLANATIEPGWMLQHFQVVYKTAYLCSLPNDGGNCIADNEPAAVAGAARINGSADTTAFTYFSGGESMLEYYPGETLLGDVQLPDGSPVGGARVTVYDGWGIPHQTVLTAPDGTFSLVLPPGNDTVNVTMGTFDGLTQAGGTLLSSAKIVVPNAVGLSYNAPNLVQTFTVGGGSIQGFVFWQFGTNSSYSPPADTLVSGAQVVFSGTNLTQHTATTDASGSFNLTNVAPGVYSYHVLYGGQNYTESSITVNPGKSSNATAGLAAATVLGTVSTSSGHPLPGATVFLGGPSGTLASTTSGATGDYRLGSVGAGNYTLLAAVAGSDLRSAGVPITLTTGNLNVSENLTVRPTGSATFVLTAGDAAAANIPVRFTPIATYSNSSVSPLASLGNASRNSTVLLSSGSGAAAAALPPGNYSVYASGVINGVQYVGLGEALVTAGSASTSLLALAPALRLSGNVAAVGPQTNQTQTAVIAYAPNGDEVVTWATGGAYSFSLPAGNYGVLALEGPKNEANSVWTALAGVTLSTATTLPIDPVAAARVAFTVGAPLAGGTLFPAGGATVFVSEGTSGPSIPVTSSGNGSVALYVPTTLPLTASSYCVRASALGFASTTMCGLSPSALAALTQLVTSLDPVPVTITVLGLPSGSSVQVNLTAVSSTAVNQTLSGGPDFSLNVAPGLYTIAARAVVGGTVIYLPPGPFSTAIPLGTTSYDVTLLMIPQVNSTGTLTVPSGVPLGNVNVSLSSPGLNVTVNGSTFESGFFAAPGTYSAYATATAGGTTYASLSRVTIASSGAVSPAIVLSGAGPRLTGTLVNASGATVPLNATAFVVAPGGAVAVANSVDGIFSLPLNSGTTYAVFVNGTTVTPGPNGSFVQSWSAAAGASCSLGAVNTSCDVPLVGVPRFVYLNGTLVASGVPGTVPGTLRLVGPYPSTNVTVVTTATGSFSASLLPGAYSLYATGGGSVEPLANLTSILALRSSSSPLSVSLSPTWVDTISVVPPGGPGGGIGPVTVTITDALGTRTLYSGQSPSSPLLLALPAGTYLIRATAAGSYGGVPSNASAQSTVTILNGNVGTVLPLTYVTTTAVAGNLIGPTSTTVQAGGTATFSFSLRNSGNVPVTVHPVGTPAYWTFDFNFGNVTLLPGPSGTVVAGEVRVLIPAGTDVAHPGVTVEFENATGTIFGSVSPAPTINVVGYYGLLAGYSPLPGQVTASVAILPFYIVNTGNVGETVVATVTDSAQLSGLGWASGFQLGAGGAATPSLQTYLSTGGNTTVYLNLTATSSIFITPRSATVSLSVLNASGSVSETLTLNVPVVSVSAGTGPGSPPVTVTGPSVGPQPNAPLVWLVPLLSFVPAIALVVGVVTYRWWRTRRWTRR